MADFDLDDPAEATLASFTQKAAEMARSTSRVQPVAKGRETPAAPPPSTPLLTRQSLVWAIALGGALDRPRCRR